MMNATTSSPSKSKSSVAENCCDDPNCGLGLRNKYYDSKRLTPASFCLEQTYGIEHRHLLNRAIHGCGLVYGYGIDSEPEPKSYNTASKLLKVSPGLVLDHCGRELYSHDVIALSIRDVMVLDKNGMPVDDPSLAFRCECAKDECWQLCVHYAEYDVDPITQQDTCNCTHHRWDKVCETVRFSLRRVKCQDCCPEPKCELDCCCEHDCCCDPKSEEKVAPSARRGGCSCLCEHLTHLKFEDCERLCEVKGSCCRTFRVAVKDPVPLACVEIVKHCDEWMFGTKINDCGPRPLVKRNDLLFDLIRGCDLTRIIEIGWGSWHRKSIKFEEFDKAFGPHGSNEEKYVAERFWVTFSGPVRKDTIRPDCVLMQVFTEEREGGWIEAQRVPIVGVDFSRFEVDGHQEWVTGFRFVVGGPWLEDAVRGTKTIFHGKDNTTPVEIEIRTDFIADCHGQAVDGNSCGLSPAPTGKGTPGGRLLSTFTVGLAHNTKH